MAGKFEAHVPGMFGRWAGSTINYYASLSGAKKCKGAVKIENRATGATWERRNGKWSKVK